MVDKTITDLTAGGAVSGADLFETEQAGATRKITAAQLFIYVESKTFTAAKLQRYTETTATATASVDRADGGIQTLALTADITLTVTIADGESLLLIIAGGDSWSITWPTITWMTGGVPTLAAETHIELLQVGATLYGYHAGDA